MKTQRQNKWLKAFIIILIVGVGTSFYIYSNKSQHLTYFKAFYGSDNKGSFTKKNILDSLNILKSEYDNILLENTYLSQQLELEKKNVERLIEIINVSKKPSSSEISIYRKQFSDLKFSLAAKILEINKLKSQNKSLLTEIESQNVVMYKQRIVNDTLVFNQKKLESTLKSASKLDVNNFKVVALREKKTGEEIETDKARSTDKLQASFLISGNTIAKTGKRIFYIQVLDQNNTVLGEDKLIEFGNDKALVYSFIVDADFQGKPVNIYGVLNSENEFRKGTYFVNFFDKHEIMGSTSITLK